MFLYNCLYKYSCQYLWWPLCEEAYSHWLAMASCHVDVFVRWRCLYSTTSNFWVPRNWDIFLVILLSLPLLCALEASCSLFLQRVKQFPFRFLLFPASYSSDQSLFARVRILPFLCCALIIARTNKWIYKDWINSFIPCDPVLNGIDHKPFDILRFVLPRFWVGRQVFLIYHVFSLTLIQPHPRLTAVFHVPLDG